MDLMLSPPKKLCKTALTTYLSILGMLSIHSLQHVRVLLFLNKNSKDLKYVFTCSMINTSTLL